jgi:hypothetical protein
LDLLKQFPGTNTRTSFEGTSGAKKKEGFYIDTRISEKIDFAKENLQILRRQVIVKIFNIHFFHSNLTPG